MKAFQIDRVDVTGIYRELIRVPALSLGVYKHAAGTDVPQQPHTEDEVYYVVSGRGTLFAGGSDVEAPAGTIAYVPAHMPHHFHSVTEDLLVLVLFAPAEATLAPAPPPM